MATFFVYINYMAPRPVKTYEHCMWSGQLSCVICFVCIIGARVSGFYCGRSLHIVCFEQPNGACLSSSVRPSS